MFSHQIFDVSGWWDGRVLLIACLKLRLSISCFLKGFLGECQEAIPCVSYFKTLEENVVALSPQFSIGYDGFVILWCGDLLKLSGMPLLYGSMHAWLCHPHISSDRLILLSVYSIAMLSEFVQISSEEYCSLFLPSFLLSFSSFLEPWVPIHR